MAAGLLHHVEINVSDLNRSIAFWGWFLEELGYTPFQEWENGTSWKLADTYLVFVQTEERFLDVPYSILMRMVYLTLFLGIIIY